ncbi:hypothetical protein IC620_15145 [Hazenella sp. IB182357]|uniref:Uncharacterized protein n=1 Tax=Polycladospora coralii TaxID=2771432 RepID=A0A926RYN5_9BACL|nr:hypothetical protein [Polycladospora coralii]MBD1373681.1 hypothetical protein [Polycladospora coralii]
MSIGNKKSNLNISTGNIEHGIYFKNKRGGDAHIVAFEFPGWFHEMVEESAVDQNKYILNPRNQNGTAPKIVDPSTSGDSYEFPRPWQEWKEEHAYNARVIK